MEIRSDSQDGDSGVESVEQLLERGLTVYSEGRIEEAISIWNQVLTQDPQNQIAMEYINTAKSDLGDSKPILEAETEQTETKEELFYDPQATADQFDQFGAATIPESDTPPLKMAEVEEILAGENSVENLLVMAEDLEKSGDIVSAVKAYEKIVSLDPTNTLASQKLVELELGADTSQQLSDLIDRGQQYFNEKKYEKAIVEWKKVLELNPNHEGIQKQITKAKSAIEAAPFIANCTRKGQEYFEQGEYESAIAEWKKILSIEPENPEILENVRMTEMLIQKTPKHATQLEEGKALLDQEDYHGAVHIFEEILNEDPDNEQVIQLYLKAKAQIESFTAPEEDFSEIGKPDEMDAESSSQVEELQESDEPVITRTSDYDESESEGSWEQDSAVREQGAIDTREERTVTDFEFPKREEKFPLKLVLMPIIAVAIIAGIVFMVYNLKGRDGDQNGNQTPDNTALEVAQRYFNQGIILMNEGKLDEAKSFFQQALEVKPDLPLAREKFEEVERLLDPSKMPEEQRVNYIKTLLAQAEEFESKKDYKQALASYQEILRIDHEHELAVEKFRQTKDILRELEKQELYNAPIPVQLKKAKEYKAVTHYEDARDLLQNILRLAPGHPEAKALLKETQEKIVANEARRDRADEMFKEGMKYLSEKNYSKAIAVFRNVLRFDPSYRIAEEKIKEAAELRRRREEAQELKRGGEFFYDIGKYDEALEKFQKLLEIDPDNEDAKFYIEKIKEYKTLGTFNP